MIWTSDTPTVPGWYWQRQFDPVTGIRSYKNPVYIGDGTYMYQGHVEWAGPIPEPEEQ